jgi:hypothetical protein
VPGSTMMMLRSPQLQTSVYDCRGEQDDDSRFGLVAGEEPQPRGRAHRPSSVPGRAARVWKGGSA